MRPDRYDFSMTVDRQKFLLWVQNEHGAKVCQTMESLLERLPANQFPDLSAILRQALILAHPYDFEFKPATDTLPYGFCSD